MFLEILALAHINMIFYCFHTIFSCVVIPTFFELTSHMVFLELFVFSKSTYTVKLIIQYRVLTMIVLSPYLPRNTIKLHEYLSTAVIVHFMSAFTS
jgi:hypothetical protein